MQTYQVMPIHSCPIQKLWILTVCSHTRVETKVATPLIFVNLVTYTGDLQAKEWLDAKLKFWTTLLLVTLLPSTTYVLPFYLINMID